MKVNYYLIMKDIDETKKPQQFFKNNYKNDEKIEKYLK